MNINLKLLESNAEITNLILSAMKDSLNNCFANAVKNLQISIPSQVKNAIISQPEYQSLISGKLKYEFGIPDSAGAINSIVDIWINNITINSIPITMGSNSLRGGFSINMIRDDYSDVLGSNSATVTDTKSSAVLPWLEWLLLHGGKIIIKNYRVQMGPSPNSRTGMAIMVSSKENWRVPPEFAGSKDNNWITRSLSKLETIIPKLIQEEIERNI